MPLNVGIIDYSHSIPFLAPYILGHSNFPGNIVLSTPKELYIHLMYGDLDISFLSAKAYLLQQEALSLIKGIGIGAENEVESVSFFYPDVLTDFERQPVYLSQESLTSNLLLQHLFPTKFQGHPAFLEEDANNNYSPQLLIGDACIEKKVTSTLKSIDLGSWWKEETGLPFLFAPLVAKKGLKIDDILEVTTALLDGIRWTKAHEKEALKLAPPLMPKNYWSKICHLPDMRYYESLKLFDEVTRDI